MRDVLRSRRHGSPGSLIISLSHTVQRLTKWPLSQWLVCRFGTCRPNASCKIIRRFSGIDRERGRIAIHGDRACHERSGGCRPLPLAAGYLWHAGPRHISRTISVDQTAPWRPGDWPCARFCKPARSSVGRPARRILLGANSSLQIGLPEISGERLPAGKSNAFLGSIR